MYLDPENNTEFYHWIQELKITIFTAHHNHNDPVDTKEGNP